MIAATLIPQVQAAVSSASIVKNILAGLVPSISGLSAIEQLAKDIGGFEFDYIGEERLEAGAEITTHFSEDNLFMQDHRSLKPTYITMRGFVAETNFNRRSLLSSIRALSSALTVVRPYIAGYSPGTNARMQAAVTQTEQIINQLAQINNVGASFVKLVGAFSQTKVQAAYNKLDALRQNQIPFAVVTPWAVFGDKPENGHSGMFIENLVMVSPEDTRGVADIVVRLVEVRTVKSLLPTTQDNARGSQLPTINGTVSAANGGVIA